MVQFNPETKQLGFDADEEEMIGFGFAGGRLLRSPNREVFNEARRARSESNDGKTRHARMRDGDILWLDATAPDFVQDTFTAIKKYVAENLNERYLETDPPFDPNALDYKRALLAREKATQAIVDLSIADAQLKAVEA